MVSGVVIAVLVLAAAASGAIFKPGDWYEGLAKPKWTPPNWLFPVVWTLLYFAIGYAGWLAWQAQGLSPAMGIWVAQLVLNAGWSWLFFGRRRMDFAFYEVSGLWLSIALFIIVIWPIVPLAALLFAPYLLWVTIAAALNYRVWQMNPSAIAR